MNNNAYEGFIQSILSRSDMALSVVIKVHDGGNHCLQAWGGAVSSSLDFQLKLCYNLIDEVTYSINFSERQVKKCPT